MDLKIDYVLNTNQCFDIIEFVDILQNIKIKCNLCHKKFSKSCHLRRHMRIHNNEKNFKCIQCNRYFNRKDILINHELTHSKIKPYNCEKCKKKFSQRGSYNRHLKKCNK